MIRTVLISLLLTVLAVPASAAVTLKDVVVQQGYFLNKSTQCANEEGSKLWDFCGCQADLVYPQVEGGIGHPLIESRVNTRLQFLASKQLCEGVKAGLPDADIHPSEHTSSYEVLVNDDRYLSVRQETYHYPAGAAHGMTTLNAVTFAMPDGKPLSMAMMLDDGQTEAINAHIYESIINQAYEGNLDGNDYWGEVLAAKKNSFINRNACDGCIAYLGKDGVTIAFQLYSVAPYSQGIVEVVLPSSMIGDEALKSYLEAKTDAE